MFHLSYISRSYCMDHTLYWASQTSSSCYNSLSLFYVRIFYLHYTQFFFNIPNHLCQIIKSYGPPFSQILLPILDKSKRSLLAVFVIASQSSQQISPYFTTTFNHPFSMIVFSFARTFQAGKLFFSICYCSLALLSYSICALALASSLMS